MIVQFRIGTKLASSFTLAVSLMIALAVYSLAVSQKALKESVGRSSMFLAEEMLKRINHDVYHRIEGIQTYLKNSLLLQTTLSVSNRQFEVLDSIDSYLEQENRAWVSVPRDAITPRMKELLDNELSTNLRKQFVEFHEDRYGYKAFVEVFLTNKYGANVAQTRKTTDYKQSDESWWQIAKAKGRYIGDIEYDESAGVHGISIGIRINNEEGNLLGIMKAVLDVRGIIREAEIAIQKYKTTEMKLVTKDGRLIYATKTFKFLEDVSEKGFFKKIKGQSSFFVAEEGGRKRLFSYASKDYSKDFYDFQWILVVGHDVREVLKPALVLKVHMILASIILIAGCVIIAFFIFRSITKRIASLAKIAEVFGKGTLDAEIDPGLTASTDEIGELATSFKYMARELGDTQKKLIRKERQALLGQLAGYLGYELRTLLEAIEEGIDFLHKALEGARPEMKRKLDEMEKEVVRSKTMISNLIEIARSNPLARQKVNIDYVIQLALSRILVPKNIEIVTRHDKPFPIPRVVANADQLAHAFRNILLNAIQAMERGRLIINLEVEGSEWMAVSFMDTGPGIPKKELGRLFEPLVATGIRKSGPGLGLAVVKKIVEAHGGTIEVNSEIGKGTLFKVRLPLGG